MSRDVSGIDVYKSIYNRFFFCARCGNTLTVCPQKSPKDTKVLKKATKESGIDYGLLSVYKD